MRLTLRDDRGQATVEVALLLPFLVAFVVLLIQVGLIVRTQVMVIHAARHAARVVAVDPAADAQAAVLSSTTLDASNTVVTVAGSLEPGGQVTVRVVSSLSPKIPLLAGEFGPVEVEASATMLVEGIP